MGRQAGRQAGKQAGRQGDQNHFGVDVASNEPILTGRQNSTLAYIVVRGELARFVAFRVEQPGMQYFAAREVFFHFLFFRISVVLVFGSSIPGSFSVKTFGFS